MENQVDSEHYRVWLQINIIKKYLKSMAKDIFKDFKITFQSWPEQPIVYV